LINEQESTQIFSIRETPIPKEKRSGIDKLNNPAKRRVWYPADCCEIGSQTLLRVHTRGWFSASII